MKTGLMNGTGRKRGIIFELPVLYKEFVLLNRDPKLLISILWRRYVCKEFKR
jgi:hypothetical protein